MNRRNAYPGNQDGAILVIVLLILVASTLIGVTVMRSANIELRIAGNERQYKQELFDAEASINAVENTSLIWLQHADPGAEVSYPADLDGLRVGRDEMQITFVDEGNPPQGTGYSVTLLRSNYYTINTRTSGHDIEVGVWKALPKDQGE